MHLPYLPFHCQIPFRRRFHHEHRLFTPFDLPLPPVYGFHYTDYSGTGDESLSHQSRGDGIRLFSRTRCNKNNEFVSTLLMLLRFII